MVTYACGHAGKAADFAVDPVICDLVMPVLGGKEVAERKPFLPSRLLEEVEEQVASHPPIEWRRKQRTGETITPPPP